MQFLAKNCIYRVLSTKNILKILVIHAVKSFLETTFHKVLANCERERQNTKNQRNFVLISF